MKIAVIAHFTTENFWDENFLEILRIFEGVVEKIFVVTTAAGMPEINYNLKKITLIRRPNIGYDFYSYRVGLYLASKEPNVEGIFILNSSFFLLNAFLFKKLIQKMCAPDKCSGVRGLTHSRQINWHLQSYLLYFDLRNLPLGWLGRHFESVQPVNSKFELVLKYEVGLGRTLLEENIPAESIFQPKITQAVKGALSYMWSITRSQGARVWFKPAFWRAWRDVNWTHFAAVELAKEYGLVKMEFLRSNPHRLNQSLVWESCDKMLRPGIVKSITNSRRFYIASEVGLSELKLDDDPLDIILQSVESVRHKIANARIAAVIHLFYLDLFEEILDELENISEPFDLYITTPFEAYIPKILDAVCRRGQSAVVVLCRNKGRDVGPFIALYRTGRLGRYDAVLKLHTKKSRYSDQGDYWRRELYKPLCGDSMTVLRTLQLIRKRGCGLIGPEKYFLRSAEFWGANRSRLGMILQSCGVHYAGDGPELAFFAGTMFWFSPKALSAIYTAKGGAVEFELENGMQDGTLAHAWERSFCLIARAAGYGVSSATLDGQDIFSLDSSRNKVPVLETNN